MCCPICRIRRPRRSTPRLAYEAGAADVAGAGRRWSPLVAVGCATGGKRGVWLAADLAAAGVVSSTALPASVGIRVGINCRGKRQSGLGRGRLRPLQFRNSLGADGRARTDNLRFTKPLACVQSRPRMTEKPRKYGVSEGSRPGASTESRVGWRSGWRNGRRVELFITRQLGRSFCAAACTPLPTFA